MCRRKEEVISFKVSEEVSAKLKELPNRSEFIRHAVASALDRICPLCHGQGSLSGVQMKMMQDFLRDHCFSETDAEGEQTILVCSHRRS